MNNTTHTPGPWYPHYAKADHCLSSSVWGKEPGNQVAVIGGKSLETMNANAALIAAAPAMYAESKTLCSLVRAFMNDNRLYDGQLIQAIHNLETAIAQAEEKND